MSKIKIDKFVEQADEKMSGYAILLDYHYKNLPIKAEPVSLLSIEVIMDGEPFKIDDLAAVTSPEWNQLRLHPNHEEYIPFICQSIPEYHPEFKIELTRYVIEEAGQEQRVILLTMPEVDDERYDLLTNGVKSLAEQCKGQVEINYQKQLALAPVRLAGLAPIEIDEAKNKLQETHEQVQANIKDLEQKKLEEIEKAHNEYLEKQESKSNTTHEAAAASQAEDEADGAYSFSFDDNEDN